MTTRTVSPSFVAVDEFPFPNKDPVGFEQEHEDIIFDEAKHIQYTPPEYVIDLEFNKIPYQEYVQNKQKYGEIAFTSPFRIMSDEGVSVLRGLIDKYKMIPALNQSHGRIPSCLRGIGYVSPFVRQLNRNATVDALVSEMAREPICAHGLPMNYGHINFGKIGSDKPVDSWHVDSVDFVMVIILSDLEGAEGGELQVALRREEEARRLLKENGKLQEGPEMMTVAYPGAGYAIFMQGSQIFHHVTAVKTAKEPRISFVNSYMRRDVFRPDMTRYMSFKMTDARHAHATDYSRLRAWRVKGMMDYILSKVEHSEKNEEALVAFERAIEEMKQTVELLKGEKNDAPGFFDEVSKVEKMFFAIESPTETKAD